MKFREHRGGLQESMSTERTIGSFDELWELLESIWGDIELVSFKHIGVDTRVNWDTYYVMAAVPGKDEPIIAGMSDSKF